MKHRIPLGIEGQNRASQAGFTLLEVLLAFVIFALSFATVLEILSASMRSTMRARDYSEAALTAQSLMDMVGSEYPLLEGVLDGETEGGVRWTLDITFYQPLDGDPYILDLADANGTQMYWVDVTLEWGEAGRERSTRFTTVKSVLGGIQ